MSPDPSILADAPERARALVARFNRLVRKDGGVIELLGVEGSVIRVAYQTGADPDCEDGVCVLPEMELQAMMAEVLATESPALAVRVERLRL